MSEQNVDTIRSVFEPLRGVNLAAIDWDVALMQEIVGAAYSPDVELTTLATGIGLGVEDFYRGADGFIRYLQEWFGPFREYYVENLDYVDAGDCVLVPSRQWGVGAGSGAPAELELTTLYELRDGLIVRVHQYDTLAEAQADAAGRR